MIHPDHNAGTVLRRAILASLAVGALGVLGMGAAYATPVTTWTYNISSVFNTNDTTFTLGAQAPPAVPSYCATQNTTTKLSWGCPQSGAGGSQSSLVINPSTATGSTVNTFVGSGTPPGSFVSNPGILLTHNNFPIVNAPGFPTYDSLKTAQLVNTVTLTDPAVPSSDGNPYTLQFGINFDETPNQYPCAVNPTNPDNPCPDIFVFSKSSLNQSFSYLGSNYFLSIFPLDTSGNLGTLSDAACTAAGAQPGCFGFVTQENSSNPLNFGLTITTSPILTTVPEPGELGIMGLGLLGIAGLVFWRRRDRSEYPIS